MYEYDDEVLRVFLKKQLQLFDEPVAETMEEAVLLLFQRAIRIRLYLSTLIKTTLQQLILRLLMPIFIKRL